MKKSFLSGVIAVGVLLASTVMSFSQCKDIVWPEDGAMKAKAQEKVTLYTDYKNNKEWKKSATHLNWLFVNVPKFNTSIYINGTDIYDELAKVEKDPARKKVYVDSLLTIYDLRAANCGEEAVVLNRKLFDFAKYYGNSSRAPEVLKLAEKVMELNGNNMIDETVLVHMQMLQINFLKKNITAEDVMAGFDKLNAVLDAKIKKTQSEGKNPSKLQKYKQSIEDTMIKTIGSQIDCEFVKKNWGPKFEADPAPELAKKIFQFMTANGCFDDPLWQKAAKKVHETEPSFSLGKNLAKIAAKNGNFGEAEEYLNEMVKLASTNEEKGESEMLLGDLSVQRGNKPSAREHYRKALGFDAGNKEAFEKIGDLYMNSFNDCAKQNSYAEDRLIYIAAYEMYQKAGNGSKMANAKAQFPSTEEIFEQNWKEGDSKRIDCWVGETVIVKTRPRG